MAGNDGAASIQACALRATRLAADGTTPAGTSGLIVTGQMISIEAKPALQTGDDVVVQNACGGIYLAYKNGDVLKRYDMTLTLPNADVELEEMLTGAALVTAGGQSIGNSAPAVGALPPNGVCLEAWAKAWIGGGPPPGAVFADGVTTSASTNVTSASAAFTSADIGRTITGTGIPALATISSVTSSTTVVISAAATATGSAISITIGRPGAYWRYVFPHAVFAPSDLKLDGSPLQVAYSGPTAENPNIGNGPLNDWPSGLLATAGRSYSRFRDSALPSLTTIGYQPTPTQV